jgi:hypothetical protein
MELTKYDRADTKPRTRALIDVLLVLCAIGLGWLFSRHILYPALHVPDSAPVILRPILGFLMAWYLVRRQGGSLEHTAQALLFGSLHVYSGAFGFAFATITGVISGAVYLLNGRNLWPLIVAHGAWDSFGMYGLYR